MIMRTADSLVTCSVHILYNILYRCLRLRLEDLSVNRGQMAQEKPDTVQYWATRVSCVVSTLLEDKFGNWFYSVGITFVSVSM